MDVAAVAELVRHRRIAEALDHMIGAWEEHCDEELGPLITCLSSGVKREPIALPTRHERLSEWLAIAEYGDAADMPRLLDCLDSFDRKHFERALADMLEWKRDPRVGDKLLSLVAGPPDGFLGVVAHGFWRQLFAVLQKNCDSGHARTAGVLADRYRNVRGHLEELFAAELDRLIEHAPTDTNSPLELGPLIDAIAQTASSKQDATIAELYQAVWKSPDDAGARGVLADALIDAGNLRGEFINLQMIEPEARVRGHKRREEELLRGHIKKWLGAIEPVVERTSAEFEGGFLARVRIPWGVTDLSRFIGFDEWKTVIEIDVRNLSGGGRAQEVLFDDLPRLRSIKGVRARHVVGRSFPRLEHLDVYEPIADDIDRLNRGDLPALEQLVVSRGPTRPGAYRRLLREFAGTDLSLRVDGYSRQVPLELWVESLLGASQPIASVEIAGEYPYAVRAERGADGRASIRLEESAGRFGTLYGDLTSSKLGAFDRLTLWCNEYFYLDTEDAPLQRVRALAGELVARGVRLEALELGSLGMSKVPAAELLG